MQELFAYGTMGSYMKNAKLQSRWELKKKSGNLKAHTEDLNAMTTARASAAIVLVQSPQAEGEESGGDRMQEIIQKIETGKKLTEDEMEYIKARDPALWSKLKAADGAEKSYQEELRRCKTKEDVQRAKMRHMNTVLTSTRAIANNPNIPEGKKLALLAVDNRLCRRINARTEAFVKKGDYARLPTDREKAQAEKLEKEAAQAPAEKKRSTEKPEDRKPEAAEADTAEQSGEPTETKRPDEAEGAKKPEKHSAGETGQSRRTQAPEFNETVQKVRRAKARAAYAHFRETEGGEPELNVLA